MIRLIEFRPEHAEELFDNNSTPATGDSKFMVREWLERMARPDRAFSMIDSGHLIVAGGIYPVWDGLGEAWMIPSDKIEEYKLSIVRHLRRHIDKIVDEDGLRRLQAAVRSDFPAAHRFIEFLGFRREGLMRSYGPGGDDYFMYARVKSCNM